MKTMKKVLAVVLAVLMVTSLSVFAFAADDCNHEEGNPVFENLKNATCTKDGFVDSVYYCIHCNAELRRVKTVIEKSGHMEGKPVNENVVPATCTEDGSYDAVVYCKVCNKELSRIAKTITHPGHDYTSVTVDETCVKDGYTEYTCSACGDTYKDSIVPATAVHTPGEAVVENYVASDCYNEGSYDSVVYCTVCSGELSRTPVVVPVTEHSYSTKTVAPTCEKQGCVVYTCTICSKSYTGDYVDALGHVDADNDGYCDVDNAEMCAHEETEVVGAIENGCGKVGYSGDIVCVACGKVIVEGYEIAMLKHKAAPHAIREDKVPATCLEAGTFNLVTRCLNCGEILESIPSTQNPIGHVDSDGDKFCDTCGESVTETVVDDGECTCDCHSDNIIKTLIWSIKKLIYRMFKINKECACGVAHY